ncbi:MAG: hypothetical protein WD766_13645 [Gemmatimonadota bacterium]
MSELWSSQSESEWRRALDGYEAVIPEQGVERLEELDRWYRSELPEAIRRRGRPHVTHSDLVRLTEWKMARGVWRARNLVLVRDNDPGEVVATSIEALERMPDPLAPIRILARLSGVGPATASAVGSAAAPESYPFLDDIVAAQVPQLPKVAYSTTFYEKYAEALRGRAERLGGSWTPTMVERALWAAAGGKAGAAA